MSAFGVKPGRSDLAPRTIFRLISDSHQSVTCPVLSPYVLIEASEPTIGFVSNAAGSSDTKRCWGMAASGVRDRTFTFPATRTITAAAPSPKHFQVLVVMTNLHRCC